MVTITSDPSGRMIHIYDNFNSGYAEDPEDGNFINLVYAEGDRPIIHTFKIHKDKIEDYIDMVRTAAGAKSVQTFTPEDLKKATT